ncbi:Pentatricopeptide repeat-containing protein [Zostera marina]|uniref:Pentatricopeptide repeat-containing protein n=1 Tax=Zostera marina TaxID=29655 RepID=A0A0K9P3R4_ZOSMR|nr:Pentatricopeptide repeat-containing protein [Zostera marina]
MTDFFFGDKDFENLAPPPRFFLPAIGRPVSTTPSHSVLEDISSFLKETKSVRLVRIVHQRALVSGLLTTYSFISSLCNDITVRYAALDAFVEAQNALEIHCPSSLFCWNVLISQNVRHGRLDDALLLCRRMRRFGTRPDHFTLPLVLKASGQLSSLRLGRSIHGVVCRDGFQSNVFVCNALIAMYDRCGSLQAAVYVFDEITSREIDDVVSWNSIVAAHVKAGQNNLALETFREMGHDMNRRPDVISLVNVLPACTSLGAVSKGKEIHGCALRIGLFSDVFVGNAIVDIYAKCGMMTDAVGVFNSMAVRDVVSWNAMVAGYSQNGNFAQAVSLFDEMRKEKIVLNVVTWTAVIAGYAQIDLGHDAINVFRQMQQSKTEPNVVTFISLLSACASVGAHRQGMELHGHALRRHLIIAGDDDMVTNGLIDMYSKCSDLITAGVLFNLVPVCNRSIVTWTVMIGGHAQHGDANSALELFSQMLSADSNICPNDFTVSCALIAASRLSALHFARQIHAYVIRHRSFTPMVFVSNSFIDTYAKCGDIGAAEKVFDLITRKNSVSWTSLMTCYGIHGRGEDALLVFEKMRKEKADLSPDGVTFLVLLYACNHSGMVNQGLEYFESMERDFGISPSVEHYACVVDLLGRAGRLQDAHELINRMPMKPTMIVWVALLGACKIHSNPGLAEFAAQRVSELDSENDGSCTLLSNIYANAGRWQDVARIRRHMKNSGVKKRPGCSWIEGKKKGGVSTFITFYVGDKSHPQTSQIYALLHDLMQRIGALGYTPEMNCALHDVDDEEKCSLLSEHSEKLALAFGLLTYPSGSIIRITKNLRVCEDCHSAFCFISKIADREIILRDPSRFHHFKQGLCSCGDYW